MFFVYQQACGLTFYCVIFYQLLLLRTAVSAFLITINLLYDLFTCFIIRGRVTQCFITKFSLNYVIFRNEHKLPTHLSIIYQTPRLCRAKYSHDVTCLKLPFL